VTNWFISGVTLLFVGPALAASPLAGRVDALEARADATGVEQETTNSEQALKVIDRDADRHLGGLAPAVWTTRKSRSNDFRHTPPPGAIIAKVPSEAPWR
jgi:hypothetical protein